MARDNKTIGRFQLTDIPPAPRGVPQIEVTFDIDANGILHVAAKDLGTGREQKITITASSGLTKDEIERMRREAETNAENDKKQREEVEARNEADSSVYRTEKMLKENGDKLPGNDKAEIEAALNQVKEALKGSDTEAIKSAGEKLTAAWNKVSEQLYKAAQAQQSASAQQQQQQSEPASDAQSGPKPSDGDVIDAEIVDDNKK
jgi:molecular chaperone DnaK